MRKIIYVTMDRAGAALPPEALARFGGAIERLAPGEAYLDVTASPLFEGSVTLIARELRRAIEEITLETATVGAAPNKFLARAAGRRAGPGGQLVVRVEAVADFVARLPVEELANVGRVTAKKMRELGLNTCADVRAAPDWQLRGWFGARASEIAALAEGRDDRPVARRADQKTVSVEATFPTDLAELAEGLGRVPALFAALDGRLREGSYAARVRGLFARVKFHDGRVASHEVACRHRPRPADFAALVTRAWSRRAEPVRSLGLGVRLAPADEASASTDQLSFTL